MTSSTGRVRFELNPFWKGTVPQVFLDHLGQHLPEVLSSYKELPEFERTPLFDLPNLAGRLSVGQLLVKDEASRLGLESFKVLGAYYAIDQLCRKDKALCRGRRTLSTATDGNHGRAVAWVARKKGIPAVIYAPSYVGTLRTQAIEGEGASLIEVPGSYDDALDRMSEDSRELGYQMVCDTSFPGYEEIPVLILMGYLALFWEIDKQLDEHGLPWPEFVFLQGGVGGFASSGILYCQAHSAKPPIFSVVEPIEAACLQDSIRSPNGSPEFAQGSLQTIMTGLNCGFPSLVSWPVLRSGVSLFIAIEDEFATTAVDLLSRPGGQDPAISTSESGAAGLAGLLALLQNHDLRDLVGLGDDATVLLVNTEGPTE